MATQWMQHAATRGKSCKGIFQNEAIMDQASDDDDDDDDIDEDDAESSFLASHNKDANCVRPRWCCC
jgi:hypothetical protein